MPQIEQRTSHGGLKLALTSSDTSYTASSSRGFNMLDDQLKVVAITAFKSLIASRKITCPATSLELLTSVLTTKIPLSLFPDSPPPKFRLTDLAKFERIIEGLSNTWADGVITFSRDEASGKMIIWELTSQLAGSSNQPLLGIGSSLGENSLSGFCSKKRKRIIDEDADSAAGDDETFEEEDTADASFSTLANLNAEMREVYAILQRSTAKGRLLAEQVSHRSNMCNVC